MAKSKGCGAALPTREIGDYDHRVIIEQPTESQNAIGETTATWSTFSNWWASKTHLGGGESETNGQRYATATYEWKGNFISGVTTKMRLNEGGLLFDITAPDETGKRDGVLRLVARQRNV